MRHTDPTKNISVSLFTCSLFIIQTRPTSCNVTQWYLLLYFKCSTRFRRFLRPSSGAQNCVHSIGYLLSFFCFLQLSWVSWYSPLCNVPSCWYCLNKLTMHGPMNVKLTCSHVLDVHSITSLVANLCTALTRRNRTDNYISHNRTVHHKTQLHISASYI
jgi:hypothetical protein